MTNSEKRRREKKKRNKKRIEGGEREKDMRINKIQMLSSKKQKINKVEINNNNNNNKKQREKPKNKRMYSKYDCISVAMVIFQVSM